MKKYFPYIFLSFFIFPRIAHAQFESFQDSVVQLYGVVMTADSLKALPAVSVMVKGENRGTISNEKGVFSIVVIKGDKVEFTSVGYKPQLVTIPADLKGNQHSMIQLMVNDTVFLPATIIRPRVSREQFERDFINTQAPADEITIARQNNDEATRRALMASLPSDGREASSRYMRQSAQKLYYSGQVAPMNIFNPFAWNEFIKAWKRGDFRKK
ncbi:MAG: carboxypeptidase-like regulatory domain-containing protein [Chitinophagaceae bacterium]|nr:carboxypeptidase-like regulatory domain-containing protein [Bacteroidota bacterium]MCC6258712.1 carboxypeptidase-like regulatory domain-containing protein [Chitinophagaceae bacterium]MCW5916067.1 carboxypeptidase-like regulatory domain-containing protein [Ferruginibacter sp.]